MLGEKGTSLVAVKDKSKVRTNWKNQPRGDHGQFVSKKWADLNEDELITHPELYHVLRAPIWDNREEEFAADDRTPLKKAHKGLWRVVIAYVIYLTLCFGAGVIGAYIGAHL
jgi:hypothetical protein